MYSLLLLMPYKIMYTVGYYLQGDKLCNVLTNIKINPLISGDETLVILNNL